MRSAPLASDEGRECANRIGVATETAAVRQELGADAVEVDEQYVVSLVRGTLAFAHAGGAAGVAVATAGDGRATSSTALYSCSSSKGFHIRRRAREGACMLSRDVISRGLFVLLSVQHV